MHFFESILMAFAAVRTNKLRSSLTLLSISIGIFAIIGAGTAITSLDRTISGQLEELGQSNFYIQRLPGISTGGNNWRKYQKRKPITFSQALKVKERLTLAHSVSISINDGGYKVKANNLSTDSDVSLIGVDRAFFDILNMEVEFGRQITDEDVNMNRAVAVIGNDIIKKIFPHIFPIGQEILVNGKKFTVIGILKSKGAVMGQSQDNNLLIPNTFFMRLFADEWTRSVELYVKAPTKEILPDAVDQAIGVMRSIRNVKPWEDNDFELDTNESIATQFEGFTKYLSFFGFGTGGIALLAAGIGIMNIMLVSVKERTREIGVRKALGARRSSILSQFMVEAITLCLLGGFGGIVLGLAGGLALSSSLGTTSAVPWAWLGGSVGVCTLLGVMFGSYPAWKAAKLDPIDALRYE